MPAGPSNDIVARLHAEIVKVVDSPKLQDRFFGPRGGLERLGLGPEDGTAFIRAEIAGWSRVVKESGAKPDQ